MSRPFRYAWPSSGIDADLMHRLYMARESSPTPTTITRLIASAVRAAYGQTKPHSENQSIKENHANTDSNDRLEDCHCRPSQGRQPARPCADPGLRAA